MPDNIEVDADRARFDAADLTIRRINMALRKLIYNDGITDVTVLNPASKHSLAVGILQALPHSLRGQPRMVRLRAHRRSGGDHQRPGGLVGG